MAVALQALGVSKHFGALKAVDNVDLTVAEGEISAVIGPNGAGKTTLIHCLTGYFPITGGQVMFKGRNIAGASPWTISRLGIVRTFQGSNVFPRLTVLENAQAGLYSYHKRSNDMVTGSDGLYRKRALEILEHMGLAQQMHKLAYMLSGGDQKRLELGIALGMSPRVLLLDEPTAGVVSGDKGPIMEILVNLTRQQGMTVVFIEHDLDVVWRFADRIRVMHLGQIIEEGAPAQVRESKKVREAYLGTEEGK